MMGRNILVLTGLEHTNQHLVDGRTLAEEFVELLPHDIVTVASLKELLIYFHDKNADVIVGNSEIGVFNYVILFGGISKNFRIAYPLATILQAREIPFFDQSILSYRGVDKLAQYAELFALDLVIPDTVFAANNKKLVNAGKWLDYPYVLKDILASMGDRNYLVQTSGAGQILVKQHPDHIFIAQRFIKNHGDIRVLINKNHDSVVFRRIATDESHLNNTSKGGRVELLDWDMLPRSAQKACRKIIDSFPNQILGIDLIVSNDHYYILECNSQPQIFSGAFTDKKIALYKKSL
jgi:glutathione synthase/RimK-type ligase-like ATP-grasp enzyme